jgi:hypothetical protein
LLFLLNAYTIGTYILIKVDFIEICYTESDNIGRVSDERSGKHLLMGFLFGLELYVGNIIANDFDIRWFLEKIVSSSLISFSLVCLILGD